MKRPSFQFYPGDWQSDLKLRRCSPAARGVWVDILCAFHDSDDGYGLLRWPLKEIASTVGATASHIRELVDKGVLRGSDTQVDEPFVYTPRSGRRDGDPVTLIAIQAGPLWYSKRLVKDEYVRTIRGESTRFGDGDGEAPKPEKKRSPKPPLGDGTPSPSPSSPSGSPPIPPKGAAAVGLKTWLEGIKAKGEKPVPEGDAVFEYAAEVGIPHDFLRLAWLEFRHRYSQPESKRYRDWRSVFRKAVRGNWLKLWYLNGEDYQLTTIGLQAQRAHHEKAAA